MSTGNPLLGIGTIAALKKEGTPGTKESLATGAAFLDPISEALDYVPVLHRIAPIAGARQADADHEFVSHHDGSGTLTQRVRGATIEDVVELILGDITATEYHPIVDDATDLPQFTLEMQKAGESEVRLIGCKTNTATFRSTTNEPLELEMNIVAMSGERDGGDHTAFDNTAWIAVAPMMHGQMSIDATAEAWLGGATGPECRTFEFTINNNLDIEGYTNSQTRKIIPVGMFELTGSMEIPYNATTAGFWVEMVNAAKVKFEVAYTDGVNTMTCAFVVKIDGTLPAITGPENVWVTLDFHGVADAVDAHCIEITIT